MKKPFVKLDSTKSVVAAALALVLAAAACGLLGARISGYDRSVPVFAQQDPGGGAAGLFDLLRAAAR